MLAIAVVHRALRSAANLTDLIRFRDDLEAMRDRIAALIAAGATKQQVLCVFEMDYGRRSTGCRRARRHRGVCSFSRGPR